MRLKIIKMGINGEGIGYENKQPIFVDGAFVDEIVDVEITETKPTYRRAKITSVVKKSAFRIIPKCKVCTQCGGCSLMPLMVKKQLEYKKQLVEESLYKYAKIPSSLVNKVIPSEDYFGYRNQFKFPVKLLSGVLYSGMYQEGTNHLVTIDRCVVHEPKLEDLRIKIMKVLNEHGIKDYYERIESGLRYVVLRGFEGRYQLTLVTGDNSIPEACIEDLSELEGIMSIHQNVNTLKTGMVLTNDYRLLYGARTLELRIEDLVFRLSPGAFFQLNYKQAINLYKYVVDLIEPCDFVVEAYSGIGAIGLMAATKAKYVEGVESVSSAVKNANQNAKFNHLNDRVKFINEDAGKYLNNVEQEIDYLIVDPPRSGLDDGMIDAILDKEPKNIIYISCNPSTLGKNIDMLMGSYNVESIQPFDMFTNTPHVEVVVKMSRI